MCPAGAGALQRHPPSQLGPATTCATYASRILLYWRELGGRVSEWEAKAIRQHDKTQESATQAELGVEPALSPPKSGRRKKRSETEAQGGEMRIPAPSPDESRASKVPGDGRSQTEPKRPRRVGGSTPTP